MKNRILTSSVTCVLIAAAQIYFLPTFGFRMDVLSDIVTFLSITFGFYITSLAIFITSQYVSNLYKTVDANDKSMTLLDTLTNNYRFGLVLTLLSLFYFIGVQFTLGVPADAIIFFGDRKLILVIAFLFLNFIYCYLMLRDLIRIIIQEAKVRAEKVTQS